MFEIVTSNRKLPLRNRIIALVWLGVGCFFAWMLLFRL
jgi:hypothetical protein